MTLCVSVDFGSLLCCIVIYKCGFKERPRERGRREGKEREGGERGEQRERRERRERRAYSWKQVLHLPFE
jgi:hypothetical protein